MAFEEIDVLPEFDLGACATCPRALHLRASVEAAHAIAESVAEHALEFSTEEGAEKLSLIVEHLKDVTGATTVTFGPDGQQLETPEDFAHLIRTVKSAEVESQDEQVERLSAELRALLDNCKDGPLKMRAAKNGHQVTAIVCVSDIIEDGEHCEDVHTRRTTL